MPEPSEPFQLAPGQIHATDWGARFMHAEGRLVAELPVITSVGLCNLCEVLHHDVVRVAGMTSHHVCFVDGGELRFAFNDRGELIELHCVGAGVAVSKDGRVMAGMRGSPSLQDFAD